MADDPMANDDKCGSPPDPDSRRQRATFRLKSATPSALGTKATISQNPAFGNLRNSASRPMDINAPASGHKGKRWHLEDRSGGRKYPGKRHRPSRLIEGEMQGREAPKAEVLPQRE